MPAAPSSQLSSSSSGSSSTCTVPTANVLVLQASQCSMAKACRQPPIVFLPKLVYDMLLSTDSSGLPKSASLLPSPSVMWTSSFRPLLSKMMTSTEQSLYYRQWTVPRPSHMDYGNRAEGRVDSFHPRRLLLSGPPQIGKTGAYLQFLSILSRMLIRLTEVDVYDEEEINTGLQEESDWHYLQLTDPWPDLELFQKMPFDYIIHDPKYEDASMICSHHQSIKSEDRGMSRKPEDLYVRRQTARMRLSKYAAYNTYHHCEQCQQYMGFHPHYQERRSSSTSSSPSPRSTTLSSANPEASWRACACPSSQTRVMSTSKAQPSPQRQAGMSTGSLICTMRWMEPTIYTCWWSRSTKWPFIRSTGPTTSCLSSQASLTVLESGLPTS